MNNYFDLSDDFYIEINVGDKYKLNLSISAYLLDDVQDISQKEMYKSATNSLNVSKKGDVEFSKLKLNVQTNEEIVYDLVYSVDNNKKEIDNILNKLEKNKGNALKRFVGKYVYDYLLSKKNDKGK